MTARRLVAAALLCAVVLAARAASPPVARVRADGMLLMTLPAEILAQREVRKQLGSGLTSTFLVTAVAGDRKGAARIEVRYEPWEEVYLVTSRGIDVVAQTARFASVERLTEWWRTNALPVLPRAGSADDVQVTLEVLPFSIEEQKETQRWLTRSLGEAHRGEAMDAAESAGRSGNGSVLDVLIGTSIQRRPIVRHRWSVAVTR
ncbi:MAG TPA: hypothetical protein VGF28_19630 [Thermoanaerobaculia bacterium]